MSRFQGIYHFGSYRVQTPSIDLLKKADVDMASPEPIWQALKYFESHLEQMKQLLR